MASYPTPTLIDGNDSHGFTTGEKYAIGFGVPLLVIGFAILGLLIWNMVQRRKAAAGAYDEQEMAAPSAGRTEGAANTSNRGVMGAPPPVSSVGVIREPERFTYEEYGGYFADDVGRGGGWSTVGRDQQGA